MTSLITAIFKTRVAAEDTLQKLESMGIGDEQVGLIVTDETRGQSFNIEKNSKTSEGTAVGATTGGLVGAILGALTTATAVAIPGLNVVIAGVGISMLAGLGTGAAAGGLVGALVGSGIPEYEAKLYEDEIKKGAILLAVQPEDDDQAEAIKDLLEREDAYNIAA